MEGWEAETDNSRSMYVCAHSPSCTMRFGEHVILGTILRPLLSLSMLLREITHKFTFRIRVSAAIPEIDRYIDMQEVLHISATQPMHGRMHNCIYTLHRAYVQKIHPNANWDGGSLRATKWMDSGRIEH